MSPSYFARQPQAGAQDLQAQGWHLQPAHLQSWVLAVSIFVMVTSPVVDQQGSRVRTMVRSQVAGGFQEPCNKDQQ